MNIILAWIPLLLSLAAYLVFLRTGFRETWLTIGLLAIWFVFFPNAIYLITEVHHFRDRFADEAQDPFWFDNIEILSIVGVGLLLGSYSLAIIQFLLINHVSLAMSWLLLIGYVFLANVGIYIGRYIRFNSWDVFTRPLPLAKRLGNELKRPGTAKTLVGYASLFSFFILMFYLFIHVTLSNLYNLGLVIKNLQGTSLQ
ncbi:MAG: DUF1361 domain-containing protein [Leptolyngbyaceae cyanobacterium]